MAEAFLRHIVQLPPLPLGVAVRAHPLLMRLSTLVLGHLEQQPHDTPLIGQEAPDLPDQVLLGIDVLGEVFTSASSYVHQQVVPVDEAHGHEVMQGRSCCFPVTQENTVNAEVHALARVSC